MEQYLKQLEGLKDVATNEEIVNVVSSGWDIVTNQIRSNASQFQVHTGLLISDKSILTNAGRAESNPGFIYAEAGVFRNDSEMSALGVTSKDIPAPMYAHWLEFGTQPHHVEKDWRRSKRDGSDHRFDTATKRGYSESHSKSIKTQKGGIRATYFISRASDTKSEAANAYIADGINLLMDEALG